MSQIAVGAVSMILLCEINLLVLLLKSAMRPSSRKTNNYKRHKFLFQTKLKSRPGRPLSPHSTSSQNLAKPQPFTMKNKHSHTENHFNQQQDFTRSACKLQSTNFQHHKAEGCMCEECSCGRHLCKLHVIKPDLTKSTVYQQSFQLCKGKPVIVTYARQYEKLKGPHLDLNTTYHQGFNQKNGDELQRPHPQDLIHLQGPVQNLTSYASQFPGHKGNNQYVKPTDRHFRGQFPLRSKSTYSDTFSSKKLKKDDYKYMKDQLKTGKNWYGSSSYGGFFRHPNPEYFAKPVKIVQKKEDNPDYSFQYQTTYKNHFVRKSNQQCPAKVHLQTRAKGSFSQSKANYNQNSDFKAFSPNFHAISTSKHCYL